jgi:3-oxoacyl-[acyl-carrier protein] reductase
VSYTSSKYAIIGLTRQLASQFGEYGININCVAPSQTKTELLMTHVPEERQKQIAQQVPLKRLAEPNEVAEVISFLASKASSYMNGAVLDVNGGQL